MSGRHSPFPFLFVPATKLRIFQQNPQFFPPSTTTISSLSPSVQQPTGALLLYTKDHLFFLGSVPVCFLWGRKKWQLAKLCRTRKCCGWMSRVIVFSLLPFRTASQSGPPFVSSTFLSCDPIDGHQLVVVHPQYPSVPAQYLLSQYFLPNILRVDRPHNIAMRYAFCYHYPKGFSMREKGGRKKISQNIFLGLNPSPLASLHVSVCGKEKKTFRRWLYSAGMCSRLGNFFSFYNPPGLPVAILFHSQIKDVCWRRDSSYSIDRT